MRTRRDKPLLAKWATRYLYAATDTKYVEYNRVLSGFPCTEVASVDSVFDLPENKYIKLTAYIKIYKKHFQNSNKYKYIGDLSEQKIPYTWISASTSWYGYSIRIDFDLSAGLEEVNEEYAKSVVDNILLQLGYSPKISRECIVCQNINAWDTVLKELMIDDVEVTLNCCERCAKYQDSSIIKRLTKSGMIKYL